MSYRSQWFALPLLGLLVGLLSSFAPAPQAGGGAGCPCTATLTVTPVSNPDCTVTISNSVLGFGKCTQSGFLCVQPATKSCTLSATANGEAIQAAAECGAEGFDWVDCPGQGHWAIGVRCGNC